MLPAVDTELSGPAYRQESLTVSVRARYQRLHEIRENFPQRIAIYTLSSFKLNPFLYLRF